MASMVYFRCARNHTSSRLINYNYNVHVHTAFNEKTTCITFVQIHIHVYMHSHSIQYFQLVHVMTLYSVHLFKDVSGLTSLVCFQGNGIIRVMSYKGC